MERFVVRKNTLPYVHQWAVIDTNTGNKIKEYKTEELAEDACESFEEFGPPRNTPPNYWGSQDAWNILKKRMKHPKGDPQPKRHSNRRRVELD